MKKITLFLALLGLGTVFCQAQTDVSDLEAVTQTLNYYLDGGTNRDPETFAKAFLPEGQMIYIDQEKGTTQIVPLKDFVARITPGEKLDRKTRIVSIQIEGNAAQARLEIEAATHFFHDFMGLLKTENGWKIVSKIFYRENKPPKS